MCGAMKATGLSAMILLFAGFSFPGVGEVMAESQNQELREDSPLRSFVERYSQDRSALFRRYSLPFSPIRRDRMREFYREWESKLDALDFEALGVEGRIDFLSDAKIDSKEGARVAEDARQSVVLDLCRLGLDKSLNPVAVGFTYPEPKNTGEHFATFCCPLAFSQPIARISFSAEDAQRRFTASNRELAISNDQILDGMIKELKSSGLVSQVKRAIIDDLPSGTPSESDIAKHVFVSSRTLQRKLAEEGTSFRELLLEVRRELAEQYISDQHMPLAEISYMLGFADQSSFFRAFKKWTGKSPAKFRSNLG
jgi:AraC-like DNA-binding protein